MIALPTSPPIILLPQKESMPELGSACSVAMQAKMLLRRRKPPSRQEHA